MRTAHEINNDINEAIRANDRSALRVLSKEMLDVGTPAERSAAFMTLGNACFFFGEYTEALDHYRQAYAANEQRGQVGGMATALGGAGNAYLFLGKYHEAMEQLRRALGMCDPTNDVLLIAKLTVRMGNVNLRTGDYKAAYEHYQRAYGLFEQAGDKNGVAACNMSLGLLHTKSGDHSAALDRFNRALTIYEQIGDRSGQANTIANTGTLYRQIHDSASAMEHYRRALEIYESLDMADSVAITRGNIGTVFMDMGEFETAIEHLTYSLAWSEKIGNHPTSAREIGNIIDALLSLGRDNDAENMLETQSTMQMDDPRVLSDHFKNRAILCEHRGDLSAAREHLLTAIDTADRSGMRPRSAEYHGYLRDLARRRNNFDEYVHHNNEYLRITEEIVGREATQKMAIVEAERKMEAERRERDKERALLYGALPESVATRMLRGDDVTGDHYDNAAVLFLDIVGFTAISEQLHPGQVVQFLEHVFSSLDEICKKHELTKIKTIGDSYLAVAFSEQPNNRITEQPKASNEQRAAAAALEMLDAVSKIMIPNGSPEGSPERSHVSVRIGMHCGAVTAGVLGKERLQYDVWGDTVNVASRMESTGEPGKIHVSEQFASLLTPIPHFVRNDNSSPLESEGGPVIPRTKSEERGDSSQFPVPWSLRERGALEVKGKGTMTTFWLEKSLPIQH